MFKKLKHFLSVTAVILLSVGFVSIATGYVYVTPPWKVINPDDPRFDPMKFRFEDYMTGYDKYAHACESVKKIITPGMPQKTVEDILIESGRAYMGLKEDFIRSYLNPVELGKFNPLKHASLTYRAQFIRIGYDQDKNVEEVSCSHKTRGSWALMAYQNARKRGRYKGFRKPKVWPPKIEKSEEQKHQEER